jgi:hypothetical protein
MDSRTGPETGNSLSNLPLWIDDVVPARRRAGGQIDDKAWMRPEARPRDFLQAFLEHVRHVLARLSRFGLFTL